MSGVNSKTKKKPGRPFAAKQINMTSLLNIAIKEFAKSGFDGVQQKEIAKKMGISNSLMNYHFGSKEDLWYKAMDHLGKKLTKQLIKIKEINKDLEGLDLLKAYTRHYVLFCAKHPEVYKILMHEMFTKTKRADWVIENMSTPLENLFQQDIDKSATKLLAVHNIPIANFSTILGGACNTFFIEAYRMKKSFGVNALSTEQIEKHADVIVNLFFNTQLIAE